MVIAHEKVVGIEYTLKSAEGEVIDSNDGHDLLYFIQGLGNIVSGLEKALDGKALGEKLDVFVKAADGYGDYNEESIHRIPKSQLKKLGTLREGMALQTQGPNGPEILTITEIQDEVVIADANHPLAGKDLYFSVRIGDIRDATSDELAHGHAHGPGGHHHH